MGGFIVQKYLAVHSRRPACSSRQRRRACSHHGAGLGPASRHIGRLDVGPQATVVLRTTGGGRGSFYSRATLRGLVNRQRAPAGRDAGALPRPALRRSRQPEDRVGAPVLVLGADEDG